MGCGDGMNHYEIDACGGATSVLHLAGDIDLAVVPDVRRDLETILDAGSTNVVLDLTHVSYADSSALGLLVWLDQRLRPFGGRLVLAGANRDIARILEISGLASVAPSFTASSNVEAALEGLDLPESPAQLLWTEHIEVPADASELASVRAAITSVLEPLGLPEACRFDLIVAVGEALSNAVRHGQPDGRRGVIDVIVSAFDDRVVVEVADEGRGFDGSHGGPDDLYATSGRGLMFMRALVDRVDFGSSGQGGTAVRLTKHRAHEY